VAHCNEIAPMLSAFSDGELSQLEADQVTQHVDKCVGCKEVLADFVLLGHHLRSAAAMPLPEDFASRVMECIAAERPGLRERLAYWIDGLRDRWVPVISLAGAAVAVASLVLVMLQPEALIRVSRLIHSPATGPQVAENQKPQNLTAAPVQSEPVLEPEPVAESESSSRQTEISRLEVRPPDVATWSEPDDKTTVIWLGDDAAER
jgi:negative regulator of sigma E activity